MEKSDASAGGGSNVFVRRCSLVISDLGHALTPVWGLMSQKVRKFTPFDPNPRSSMPIEVGYH